MIIIEDGRMTIQGKIFENTVILAKTKISPIKLYYDEFLISSSEKE